MTDGEARRMRQERAAHNQSLFREINERIAELNETFDVGLAVAAHEWVCECWDDTCTERVHLTTQEYEQVRAQPTHFLVVADHFDHLVEGIAVKNERYWVVEKIENAAAVAREKDPRKRHQLVRRRAREDSNLRPTA